MLRKEEFQSLNMGPAEQLAANCPPCFGPPVGVPTAGVPDMVVCIDANFQQRRHMAASTPNNHLQLASPELFLEPAKVQLMADHIRPPRKTGNDEVVVRV